MKIELINLIYVLVGGFVGSMIWVGVIIWKFSSWQTKFVLRIDKNEKDINHGFSSIREYINRKLEELAQRIAYKNRQQDGEIRHISRYLEENTSYRHPTFNDFDSNQNDKGR